MDADSAAASRTHRATPRPSRSLSDQLRYELRAACFREAATARRCRDLEAALREAGLPVPDSRWPISNDPETPYTRALLLG